ncbi:MAG: MBL fold metallo-hydrolase [Candidatus Thorarchaeota archaeon]|nr:MBL fold metallo-hydrolase [Candidatus Thorarchaeota archaeon]
MHVTVLGTGTSYPDPDRVQSGVLVESGDFKILLDVGSGILHRLTQTKIDLTDLSAVFFTHFHIDHCSDFLPLYQTLWLEEYQETLEIYGSADIHEWLKGINEVSFPYLLDRISTEVNELAEHDKVDFGEVKVEAHPTCHSDQDSRAFKVTNEDASLVYTGDTSVCEEVIEMAKDVDVLIHECNWLDGDHREGVHTSPSELNKVVSDAGPVKVILVHVSPPVVREQDSVVEIVGRSNSAEVVIGEDLVEINL